MLTNLTTKYCLLVGIHTALAGVCLALFVIVLATYIARTKQYYRYRAYNEFLKKQLVLEKQLYKNIDKIYDETRIMRHDTKHYLTTVLGLLVNEEYQAAEKLIMDVLGKNAESSMINYGASNIINTVLNVKNNECKNNQIPMEIIVSGGVPKNEELNIAIILSNLLDNAIEANTDIKDKGVWVDMYEQKGMFYLTVKNNVDEKLLINNPKLESTKKDGKNHGVGILSVKTLVKEADGSYETTVTNNQFNSYVTIPFNM